MPVLSEAAVSAGAYLGNDDHVQVTFVCIADSTVSVYTAIARVRTTARRRWCDGELYSLGQWRERLKFCAPLVANFDRLDQASIDHTATASGSCSTPLAKTPGTNSLWHAHLAIATILP